MKKFLRIGAVLLIAFGIFACGQTKIPEATDFEKTILDEVNLMRKNPKSYFDTYIVNAKDVNGIKYSEGQNYAVAYADLQNGFANGPNGPIKGMNSLTADLGQLVWKEGLYKCCKAHSMTQGKTEDYGHDRTNGKSWDKSIGKYGTYSQAGENIAYGYDEAREIVIALLMDETVDNRGHRDNLLADYWTDFGASYDEHKKYNYMCCMDFATDWQDK